MGAMNRGVAKRGAVVIALLLALSSGAAMATLPDGAEQTSLAMQNTSNDNNVIQVQYQDESGDPLPGAGESYPLAPGRGVIVGQVNNPNLPDGAENVGTLEAAGPFAALLVRRILANRPNDAHSYSIVTLQSQGAPRVALPILLSTFSNEEWSSRFNVVNAGSQAACIRVTYYISASLGVSDVGDTVVDSPTGQSGCATGHRLPVGGQLVFGDTGSASFPYPAGVQHTQSAALVEVLNANGSNDIVASVDIFRGDGNRLLGSYDGFAVRPSTPATDDVGTEVVMPLAIKHSSGYYSVIGVQNLGPTAADVSIRYLGSTEGGIPVDTTVLLPAVSNVGFHSTFDTSTPIPVDFVGYAVVTSPQPVAAMLVRGKQTSYLSGVNEPIYTAVNGVPRDRGSTGWSLPLIYRRYEKLSSEHIGWNSWIQVQVADGSSAQVTLRFLGMEGSGCGQGPYQATTTVNGSKVFYMNADADNGFPPGQSPACFLGTAQVSSTKPVIVIANVSSDNYPGGDNEALYNAVPGALAIPQALVSAGE